MDYMDDGGNVVLWITVDTSFYSYDSGNYQLNYIGFNRTGGFNHIGIGGYMTFPLTNGSVPTSPIRDGPVGNGCNMIYPYQSYPYSYFGLIPPSYVTSGTDKWAACPRQSVTGGAPTLPGSIATQTARLRAATTSAWARGSPGDGVLQQLRRHAGQLDEEPDRRDRSGAAAVSRAGITPD